MISDLSTSHFEPRTSSLSFSIPPSAAQSCSYTVGVEALEDARRMLRYLEQIHGAKKKLPMCRLLARGSHGGRTARRWTAGYLYSKYYQFLKGTPDYPPGDWRICLNHSKAPALRSQTLCPNDETPVAHRKVFIEFWRRLCERNQRNNGGAYDELLQIWRTGIDREGKLHKFIPGYGSPQPSSTLDLGLRTLDSSIWPKADPFTGIPSGWSEENLRRYVSDPYDQVAARQGHAAASALRFPTLTTRTTLRLMQFAEFDDHEFDSKILFQRKPMRPLGFGSIDIFSGCLFNIGLKPTLWDFDDEVRRKLTELEFMWFVVACLCEFGYRRDKFGTHLIVERGIAAIRSEFEARLLEILGGYVTVERGGRFGKPAHAGQFEGRSKGNYRTKALIESIWSLLNNQLAMVPGQVGKDRDHSPEQLHGQEQYTAKIISAAESAGVPVGSLQFPFPAWHQWREYALNAVAAINGDRSHDLQGWEQLGFVQPVWRLPSFPSLPSVQNGWMPQSQFLALPPAEQTAIKSILDANPDCVSTLRLTRREVFDAGRKELTRVPLELIPQLVGRQHAYRSKNGNEAVTVDRGLLTIECAEIDPEPLRFYARRGDGSFLPNDSEYICFLNPYLPTHLIACSCSCSCSSDLRVVAVCERYHPIDRTNPDQVQHALGVQSAFEAQGRQRLDLRHADQAAEKEAMLEHNRRLVGTPSPASPSLTVPRGSHITQNDFVNLDDQPEPRTSHLEPRTSQEDALNSL